MQIELGDAKGQNPKEQVFVLSIAPNEQHPPCEVKERFKFNSALRSRLPLSTSTKAANGFQSGGKRRANSYTTASDNMRPNGNNSFNNNSHNSSGVSSATTTSAVADDVDDCRQKIYNQFKRSTSYGGIDQSGGFKKAAGQLSIEIKPAFGKESCSYSSGDDGNSRSSNNNNNKQISSITGANNSHDDPEAPANDQIGVSDIIGSFGLFQALVLLFSGLREGLVGYDALVMSIILQPDENCKWPLVCQNHWLMVIIESAYFLGLVTGNLFWGFCADKFGRRPSYLAAHTMSVLFGFLAILMPSVYLFAVCRYLAAFGSIGYNIIYSIQVELIGLRHRSFSTILNHLGWGLGVICVPIVNNLMQDYHSILIIAPILSLVMFPWAFWLPESSRWLMANGRFEEARRQLIRAAKCNGRTITSRVEKSIWVLEQRVRAYKLEQEQQPGPAKNAYKIIFTNPKLLRDTSILAYLAFVGHLFYYVQTLNFVHVRNLSTEANFISSGAGEWVSVVVGATLLKFFSRKTCMSLFLLIMTCSFAFQSLVDSDLIPALDTAFIITTNNGLGTLSSLLLIFIALIVNQEVFPTIVRQTGTSFIGSLGESGSLLAPLLIYVTSVVGPVKANASFTFFCVLGIIVTQFLTKTDNMELPDT